MKDKLVILVGPTGVGKTNLSLKLADKFAGEIISGDSMQVYKGFDIGTDKIMPSERNQIPHYLIDIKEAHESYSTADFQKDAGLAIDHISAKGKLPILVGGSGLYVQSVIYDYQFSESKRDEKITKELELDLETYGQTKLYERLRAVDPEQADKIHPNNHIRLIRALETYLVTGQTMTERNKMQSHTQAYDALIIGLTLDRSLLYERINKRVDEMIEAGLVQEVERFYRLGLSQSQSMRGIGYKEFIPYFEGDKSLISCIEQLKQNSRNYAKRQLTWFNNKLAVNWFDANEINNNPKEVEALIKKFIKENEDEQTT